jgi:hypothetical protein
MAFGVGRRGGAGETRIGEALDVGAPGDAGAGELGCQVWPGGEALGAVFGDPEGVAADQRQVVGQGRVRDPEVVDGEGAAPGEVVEVGRLQAADDFVVLAVLEHDEEDVRGAHRQGGGDARLSGCGRGTGRAEAEQREEEREAETGGDRPRIG